MPVFPEDSLSLGNTPESGKHFPREIPEQGQRRGKTAVK